MIIEVMNILNILSGVNIPIKFYFQHAIARIINFFQSSDDTENTDIPAFVLETLCRVLDYSKNKVIGLLKIMSVRSFFSLLTDDEKWVVVV